MQKVLMAAVVALVGLAAAPATAMPIGPVGDGPSGVTLVAEGCGPGFVRGPYGHCHPMGYPHPAYGVYAHPHAHPYGGHCWWRNGVRICN